MEPKDESKKYVVSRKYIVLNTVVLILFIIAVIVAGYYHSKYSTAIKDPQAVQNEITRKIVDEVSQLMILPQDEIPTLATVTDPSILSSQPFFAHAAVGDRVLIYTQSNKAILYRPSTHKIIDVAPLSVGTETVTIPPKTSPQPSATTTKKL